MLELRALPEARPGQVRLSLRWTDADDGLSLRRRALRPPERPTQGEALLVLGGEHGLGAPEDSCSVEEGEVEGRWSVSRDPLTQQREHQLTLIDRGGAPGQPTGYAVFSGEERLAALSVVPAAERGSAVRLYEGVPAALRRLDEAQEGQLRAFLAVLGAGLDLARSGDARLEGLHDLRRAPEGHLDALQRWLGWPGQESGEALREALRRAPAHYDQAGTLEGLRVLIRQRTTARLQLRQEADLLLRTWEPAQLRGWDLFTSRLDAKGWSPPTRWSMVSEFVGGPRWAPDGRLLAHRWTGAGFRLVMGKGGAAWSARAVAPGVDQLDPLALGDGRAPRWRFWREAQAGASTLWRQVGEQAPAPLTGLDLHEDLLVGAPAASGGLHLAWRALRERRPWLALARLSAAGGLDWQAEALPGLCGLSMCAQGPSPVLATLQTSGSGSRLELRRWEAAGRWRPLSALTLPLESLEPSVAQVGRTLHVVWSARGAAGWRLQHARFVAGAWSEPAHLLTGPAADRAPVLGIDASGALRLAWRSQRARTASTWTTVNTDDSEAIARWGQHDDPLSTTVDPGGRRDLPVVSVHLGPGPDGPLPEDALAAVAAGVDDLTALHLRLRWVAEEAKDAEDAEVTEPQPPEPQVLELPDHQVRALPAATLTWTDSTPTR